MWLFINTTSKQHNTFLEWLLICGLVCPWLDLTKINVSNYKKCRITTPLWDCFFVLWRTYIYVMFTAYTATNTWVYDTLQDHWRNTFNELHDISKYRRRHTVKPFPLRFPKVHYGNDDTYLIPQTCRQACYLWFEVNPLEFCNKTANWAIYMVSVYFTVSRQISSRLKTSYFRKRLQSCFNESFHRLYEFRCLVLGYVFT